MMQAAARMTDLLAAFSAPGAPDTTFFELTTLLAIEAFRDHACDVVVLEVGLGGRLDATNATPSVLSVVTGIAFDHTAILGASLAAIAREKAGIFRREVPVVLAVRDASARRVLARRAARLGCATSWIDRDFAVVAEPGARGRFGVRVGARVEGGLRLGMLGRHQRDNAACVVAAVERLRLQGFEISSRALRGGLSAARSSGRLERIPGRPVTLLDAAHNPQGAQALAAFLQDDDPWLRARVRGPRVLLFGCMRDKDHGSMMCALHPLFDRIYFHAPQVRRAMTAVELARRYPGRATRGLGDALARARRSAGEHGEVVVAGSIFLIGEVRARLLGRRRDPLIRM
jgi:dihydrofolate synthase/folylpolyglutamate synthase